MGKGGWFLILLLSLTACVSTVEPTETPFSIQQIVTAPELEGLISPWLAEYVKESGHATLQLDSLPSAEILTALETKEFDVGLISQDVSKDWFVTPLWREAIAVIINPEVELSSLDIEALVDVFSGRIKTWDTLTGTSLPIQPIIPFPGSIVREKFLQVVMSNSSFDPAALLGGTPDAIFELVKSERGAIGFLPIWRVQQGVDIVMIAGISPQKEALESGAYPLWLDILAVSPEEPVGDLRDFIVWLQGSYLPTLSDQ
jgi:ABC-type phosphate transport system substrate-binding protein